MKKETSEEQILAQLREMTEKLRRARAELDEMIRPSEPSPRAFSHERRHQVKDQTGESPPAAFDRPGSRRRKRP
jgi:hypothetical protein